MKKILVVFGTRPEAIKMIPIVNELYKRTEYFLPIVCVTGQHRQLLDQVLDIFDIVPDYDLNIMQPSQDLYDITSNILLNMRELMNKVKPDIALVHGDTTTSMVTALSAFYSHIPVAHVEAGLRTYNLDSPWPEEANRQLTARLATYHFAPTQFGCDNLLTEHIEKKNIFITGNTVIDSLHLIISKLKNNPNLEFSAKKTLSDFGYKNIEKNNRIILITGHRRENFGKGFENILNAIQCLAEKYPTVDFIYPVHFNPNVRNPIQALFANKKFENIFFIEPLDYLSFVYLMDKSFLILTDSGGIQEEAPGLGKPVLVMRNTTERPEAVEAGTVKLVGTDYNAIIDNVSELIDDADKYSLMSNALNPYGDGTASKKIVDILVKIFYG